MFVTIRVPDTEPLDVSSVIRDINDERWRIHCGRDAEATLGRIQSRGHLVGKSCFTTLASVTETAYRLREYEREINETND